MKRLREVITEEFTCSMSLETISDPVATECGQIYERESLERWFASAGRKKTILDPNTGEKIGKKIIPLPKLRNILRYCEEYSDNINADIAALEEAEAKRNAPKAGDLVRAALTGDIKAVERVHNKGRPPNDTDSKGRTALHVAAEMGFKEIVEFLILNGAPIDAVTKAQETPLMYACTFGKSEVIRILRCAGANESLKSFLGKTAMDMCSDENVRKVFEEDRYAILKCPDFQEDSSSESALSDENEEGDDSLKSPNKKQKIDSESKSWSK